MKLITLFLVLLSWSLFFPFGSAQAATCNVIPPGNLKAVRGSAPDQANLFWDISPSADHYLLSYGLMSNQYIFGANNLGGVSTRSFTVKSLKPGTRYFFRVAAVKDCASFSNEATVMTKKDLKSKILGTSTHKKLVMSARRI